MQSAIVWDPLFEKSRREGGDAGAGFWRGGGDGGAGGEDGAGDVAADDGGVGEGGDTVVALVVVDVVEGDGFDGDEEFGRAGGGGCAVGDDEAGAFGGEDGGEVVVLGGRGACDCVRDLVGDGGHDVGEWVAFAGVWLVRLGLIRCGKAQVKVNDASAEKLAVMSVQ